MEGRERGEVEGGREGIGEGMRGREAEGTPKGWFTPHVRNSEKYPDCITDLIGGDGNTDVCPGRQTPRAATAPPVGFPWNDLRKILLGSHMMAKVQAVKKYCRKL